MPKRKEYENDVWQAFIEACGNHCNFCLKEDVRLEAGHLLSDADDGSSALDNLIPLCRSCNASNREGLTQDLRPTGWRDAFVKRLLSKFGIGLSAPTEIQCADSADLQVTENTRRIDWSSVTFVKADSLLPTATDRLNLSEEEALALVEEMILAGRKSDLAAPPLMRRKGKLIRLARFGRENFTAACESFFYQQPWEQTGFGDAWAYLCDNYGMYVREGLAARKRNQERRESERDARRKAEEEARVAREWAPTNGYLSILRDGDPIDDRAFKESFGVVNEELLTSRGRVLFDELVATKKKLRELLVECCEWARGDEAEYEERIKELSRWIERADLDALRKNSWWVTDLHDSLNPQKRAELAERIERGEF